MILVYFLAFLQRSLTEKLDFNTLIIVLLRAESVMSLALLLLLLPLLLFSFHLYIFLFLSDTKQMCLSRRTLNKFYIYGAQYVRGLVCVCACNDVTVENVLSVFFRFKNNNLFERYVCACDFFESENCTEMEFYSRVSALRVYIGGRQGEAAVAIDVNDQSPVKFIRFHAIAKSWIYFGCFAISTTFNCIWVKPCYILLWLKGENDTNKHRTMLILKRPLSSQFFNYDNRYINI